MSVNITESNIHEQPKTMEVVQPQTIQPETIQPKTIEVVQQQTMQRDNVLKKESSSWCCLETEIIDEEMIHLCCHYFSDCLVNIMNCCECCCDDCCDGDD